MFKINNKKLLPAICIATLVGTCLFGCQNATTHTENATTAVSTDSGTKENLPEKPYGTKISGISDKGITVYWKKPEFADGYEVFRSYEENGDYESIYEAKKNVGTYNDTTFDHTKKTVYYRLKSFFRNENGEKTYSGFTKILTANYREKMKLSHSTLYIPSNTSRIIESYHGWGNTKNVTWTSDNDSVARVEKDGTVTALQKGECTITCISEELGSSLTCKIVVDREPLEPLTEITSRFTKQDSGYWENIDTEKSDDAVIMMTGDMMCTSAQQRKQDNSIGDYNFNESFDYVKSIFEESDFAIGNLETILSSSWPYMVEEIYINDKPNCNAPSRYLDALKYAGFDAFSMSNNHNCDGGERAILETNKAIDDYRFARTGLFSSKEEERILLADINGIKVAYLSYSVYPSPGFNTKDKTWPQESVDTMLNIYSKEKADKEIAKAKEAGAEYIIAYMHWGVKNVFEILPDQSQPAQELADAGVDFIVGGHSHLVQPYQEITAKNGKIVPCYYSLGDFHSSINQIPGNRDSIIVRIRLKRNADAQVELVENGYIPCYTKTKFQGKHYVTLPLNTEFTNEEKLIKQHDKFRTRIEKEVGGLVQEYVPNAK